MIPEAEWRRIVLRTKDSVRYPAWYPWFLRGDEASLERGGDARASAAPSHDDSSSAHSLGWRHVRQGASSGTH